MRFTSSTENKRKIMCENKRMCENKSMCENKRKSMCEKVLDKVSESGKRCMSVCVGVLDTVSVVQ